MKKRKLSYSKLHKYPYKRGNLMHVSVEGIRSKKIQRLTSSAAEFYAGLLLSKRTANIVDLNIIFKNKLDGDAEGYCTYMSQEVGVREFEIQIDKNRPTEELLLTLAHEMVHLKQFATRELISSYVPAHMSRWQGRLVNEKQVDYWDLPWEIEANGRERGLFYRFCDKVDIYK